MGVWEDAARHMREAAADAAPQVERYKVRRAAPLLMEEMGGDNVLQDGDDDLVLSFAVMDYMTTEGLEVGDVIRVIYDDGEFTAMGVDD